MDIQQLFNVNLPAWLAAQPDIAQRVGAKFQFNISGEGGGQWFIDASSAKPRVEAGNPGGADCTISVSATDFQQLLKDPSSGMQLFFSGRLQVTGNPMLAMKLQELLRAA